MIDNTGISVYFIGISFSLLFILIAGLVRTNIAKDVNVNKINVMPMIAGVVLILSFLSMWLIAALRDEVGVDYYNYFNQYEAIKGFSDIGSYYEPGYGLLNYLVHVIFDDFQWVLIITSLLTGFFFWKSIYRDGGGLVLCVLGLIAANLYFMSFTVIRQFLAIAILTMTIPHIKQRNFRKFLIYYLLAVSIHYTAAVFIVLYLFAGQKSEKMFTLKNILFMFAVLIFFVNMDNILSNVISIMSDVKDNYLSYSDSDGQNKNMIEVIVLLPVMIFGLIKRKKLIELNPNNDVYIWMSVFLIITKLIGIYYVNFSRIHYYFVFSMPVLLSYAPKSVKIKWKPFAYGLVLLYFAYTINNIHKYQYWDFLPYYSIWN